MITKIPYIRTKVSKGRRYTYFEHPASDERKRIFAKPKTAAFFVEYAQLMAEVEATPKSKISRRQPHGSGTWAALVDAYRASAKYTLLKERTKRDYDGVLAYLASINEMPLIQFDAEACEKIRDRALADKKQRFANYVVQMLMLVLAWGKGHREFGQYENGAAGLKKFAAPGNANRPWTEDECRIVIAEATGALKAAIALGMFASMRAGDVVDALWSDYSGTAIQWQQNKTADPVWKPARRLLREILDATPRIGETIVTRRDGRPWLKNTLASRFHHLIRRLERQGRVAKGLTFHGLRSTNATRLADAGADVRAIQAEMGHRTPSMAFHYSRRADMRRAAETATRILDDESD